MKSFSEFQEEMNKKVPPVIGLGGGGGGTDSIMAPGTGKSFKKRVGDVAKVLTFPFHKRKKDPTEKFASEELMANNISGGQIAGSVEAGDDPPVKKNKRGSGMKNRKKKTYAYGGRGSRKMWMT